MQEQLRIKTSGESGPFSARGGSPVAPSVDWSSKSVWVQDEDTPYVPGTILSQDGDIVTVKLEDGSVRKVNMNDTERMNPPKFDGIDDMSNLAHLNEPSILHNLKLRYNKNKIYSYSGLFLIAINPYKNLNMYSDEVVESYMFKKNEEMPPHIFAVADKAYYALFEKGESQSILITGESGAGKTENTKRVIQYLAALAGRSSPKSKVDLVGKERFDEISKISSTLENQIIGTNVILEAFGNAKTIKNNNSSRFGKFIRIMFDNHRLISGGKINWYLLEKNRITHNSDPERSYHVFYQFMKGAEKSLKDKFLLSGDVSEYRFLKSSSCSIPNVDDSNDFKQLVKSMDITGISKDVQDNLFRVIAAILHLGEISLSETEDESVEFASEYARQECERACHVLGVPVTNFTKALFKPKIKAGREIVTQTMSLSQIQYSIEALARAIYERTFGYLVKTINRCITAKKSGDGFVSVLDIAGFEIFEKNSFEQLCINYTNERLQQFFNHCMFIHEQEEYRKENIEWTFIDFGMDLQPTVDLIERSSPVGIFPCLDEECVMPKATDKTFLNKLDAALSKKSQYYETTRFRNGFIIKHYAGNVNYSVSGWLDKNKDPLNESLTKCLAVSSLKFIGDLFSEYKPENSSANESNGMPSIMKKGIFRTVSQRHREQLNSLMCYLNSTEPHFVRCILPNIEKKAHKFDPVLVKFQLKCNGVLEGIRIFRTGFPNKVMFEFFNVRYQMLASKQLPGGFVDGKKMCQIILDQIGVDKSRYRMGKSKVFFRTGVLAELEEMRDRHLSNVIITIQRVFRGWLARRNYRKLYQTDKAVAIIKKNIRAYLQLCKWPWWKLYTKVRPLVNTSRAEEELLKREEEIKQLQVKFESEEKVRQKYEEQINDITEQKKEIENFLSSERAAAESQLEVLNALRCREAELKDKHEATLKELQVAKNESNEFVSRIKNLEANNSKSAQEIESKKAEICLMAKEKQAKEERIKALENSINEGNTTIAKIQKDLKTVCTENDKLKVDLECHNEEIAELKKQLSSSSNSSKVLEKKHNDVLESFNKVTTENEALKNALNVSKAEISATKNELQNVRETCVKHQDEIKELHRKVSDESSQKEIIAAKAQELKESLNDYKHQFESKEGQFKSLEFENNRLKDEVKSLQSLMEEKGSAETKQSNLVRLKEAEIASLAQNLAQKDVLIKQTASKSNEIITGLKQEVEQARRENASHSNAQKELRERIQNLNSELETSKAEEIKLKSLNSSLNSKISNTIEELDKKTKAMEAFLEEKSKTDNLLSEMRSKSNDLEDTLGQTIREKERIERLFDSLKENFEQEMAKSSSAETQKNEALLALSNCKARLEEEILAKEDIKRQLTTKMHDLSLMNQKYDRDISTKVTELEKTKSRLQKENAELMQKCEDYDLESIRLNKRVAWQTGEIEDLRLWVEREHKNASTLNKNAENYLSQLKSTAAALESEKAVRINTESMLENLKNLLAASTNELKDKNTEIEALVKNNENLDNELKALVSQMGSTGKSIHKLEKEKKNFMDELEKMKRYASELEERIEKNNEQRSAMEQQFNEYKKKMEEELQSRENSFNAAKSNLITEIETMGDAMNELVEKNKELEGSNRRMEDLLKEGSGTSTRGIECADKIKEMYENKIKSLTEDLVEENKMRKGFEDQSKRFEKKINTLQTSLENLGLQFENSEKERKVVERNLAEALSENQNLVSENNYVGSERKHLEEKCEEQSKKIEELQDSIREFEAMRISANPELDAIKDKSMQDLRESLEKSEVTKRLLSAKLRELEVSNSNKDKKIKKLNGLISSAGESSNELKTLTEQYKKRVADLESELRKISADYRDAKFKIDSETANNNMLNEMNTALKEKNSNLMAKIEEAELSLIKSKKDKSQLLMINDLKEQYKQGMDKILVLKNELEEKEKQLAEIKHSESETCKELEESQKQVRLLMNEIEVTREMNKKELLDHEALIASLKQKEARMSKEHNTELELERETVLKHKNANRELSEKLDKAVKKMDEMTLALGIAKKDKERTSSTNIELMKSLKDTKTVNAQLQEHLNLLTSKNQEMRKQLQESEQRISEYESNDKIESRKLEEDSQERSKLLKKCSLLEANLKKYKESLESLESGLEEAKDNFSQAETRNRNLETEIASLKAALKGTTDELSSTKREKSSLERRLEEVSSHMDDAGTNIEEMPLGKHLEKRVEDLNAQIESERSEKKEISKELRKLKRTNATLLTQLQEERAKVTKGNSARESADSKLKLLTDRLNVLENELHESRIASRKMSYEYDNIIEKNLFLIRELEHLRSIVPQDAQEAHA